MFLRKRLLIGSISFVFVLLTCAILKGQAPGPSMKALTNQDVIELVKAGLSSEVLTAKIKSSACNFDTSPSALKDLKGAGVPDGVILAMVQVPTGSDAGLAPKGPLKTVSITCINAKEIPAYPSPDVSTAIANPKCGENVSILDHHGSWAKIRTEDGTTGWVSQYFLPGEAQVPSPTSEKWNSAAPSSRSAETMLPNVLHSVAWRGIPWATTSYWQQPESADTSCTGSGNWLGDTWHGNASCNTHYTPAQSIPINWQYFTIYNLVETSDSWMVIGCTRNWAFSKCSYLVPGSSFPYEIKKGRISLRGQRAGKDKEQTLELDIISSQAK
jgi:hypothetical protein